MTLNEFELKIISESEIEFQLIPNRSKETIPINVTV
jgi:hypothetical protein